MERHVSPMYICTSYYSTVLRIQQGHDSDQVGRNASPRVSVLRIAMAT